jgi:DNA replication regulator DPB11
MVMFNVDERAEESMRVEYEDPGQMDEKARLMSLLGSQKQSQDGNLKKVRRRNEQGIVRRSSRTANF